MNGWQISAQKLVQTCEENLWGESGENTLKYLHNRGLKNSTLEKYHIGCFTSGRIHSHNNSKISDLASPNSNVDDCNLDKASDGILIPCFQEESLESIKIFREVVGSMDHKVTSFTIPGSKPSIFGTSNFVHGDAVFAENELDAMLLDQEIGDLIGIGSLGDINTTLKNFDFSIWGKYLLRLRRILIVYNDDVKGVEGYKKLQSISERFIFLRFPNKPTEMDLITYWLSCSDIRQLYLETFLVNSIQVRDPLKDPAGQFSRTETISLDKILQEYLDRPYTIDPSKPCYACGQSNYLKYPDGSGFFCATCHPPALSNHTIFEVHNEQ